MKSDDFTRNFLQFFAVNFLQLLTHCASPTKVEVLAISLTLAASVLTTSLISTEVRVNAEAGDIIGEDAASIDLLLGFGGLNKRASTEAEVVRTSAVVTVLFL